MVTAESCTGGLLGKMVTDVPGASAWFLGGIVAYYAAGKHRDLGVPLELLRQHGEVSEPVARAMAECGRQRFDADYALSITGIAGPTGGDADDPVGTVWIALADRQGPTLARRFLFSGDRQTIRDRSAKTAMNMLRLRLRSNPQTSPAT